MNFIRIISASLWELVMFFQLLQNEGPYMIAIVITYLGLRND
jgi:hypothetical protein